MDPEPDDPRVGVVEKFYGLHGETFFVSVAPMDLVIVHIDQVAAALPREEAARFGRRILQLSEPEEEGGDQ
ncbi:hypothetical protein [Kitasatospora sp. NPDC127116]|uniref:hypothetical protein n=1 Tax=Kitasatospora sp. NPDC127116 TaxID=3345367 RepID=UPI0036306199